MFLKHSFTQEIESSIEDNLLKIHSSNENNTQSKLQLLTETLKYAQNRLQSAGLFKEANAVCVMVENLEDPATKHLTPEKMVENLKEKGWVFNADDCSMLEEHLSEEPELVVEHHIEKKNSFLSQLKK